MTRIAAAILLGFFVLAGMAAYLGRYEVTQATGAWFLLTDRWTGRVSVCFWLPAGGSKCEPVYPPQAAQVPSAADVLGPIPAPKP